jgi:hypothetical protein
MNTIVSLTLILILIMAVSGLAMVVLWAWAESQINALHNMVYKKRKNKR